MSDQQDHRKSPLYKGLDSLSLGIAIAGVAIGIGIAKSDNDLGVGLKSVTEAITVFNQAANPDNTVTLTCEYDHSTTPSDYSIHPEINKCLQQKEMIERVINQPVTFEIVPR